MMFHGLGDDNSAGAQALAIGSPVVNPAGSADCQWCQANPGQAMFYPSCWATKTMFGGSCMALSIPQAYAAGANAAPPSQSEIDSQSPEETINQILSDTQANAVSSAVNSDAVGPIDSATNPFGLPDLNLPGLNLPSGSTMWIVIGVTAIAIVALAQAKTR